MPKGCISRYLRGAQSMEEPLLVEVVLLAYDSTWLNREQISHLGYLPLVNVEPDKLSDTVGKVRKVREGREYDRDEAKRKKVQGLDRENARDQAAITRKKTKRKGTVVAVEAISLDRRKARDQFYEGIARLLRGEMAGKGKAIERKGTEIRIPLNDVEMEKNYERWINRIEKLGGHVTTETWAPAWYWEAEQHFLPREEELVSDCGLEQMHASAEAAQAENPEPLATPLPQWHPSRVHELKLWFGGREWSPWQHAIEEDWWTEVRGDDLSDFLDAHDAREEARWLAS